MEEWLYKMCSQIIKYVESNVDICQVDTTKDSLRSGIRCFLSNTKETAYRFCRGGRFEFWAISSDNTNPAFYMLFPFARLRNGKIGIFCKDLYSEELNSFCYMNVLDGIELCEAYYTGFINSYKFRYDVYDGSRRIARLFGNDKDVVVKYLKFMNCKNIKSLKSKDWNFIFTCKCAGKYTTYKVICNTCTKSTKSDKSAASVDIICSVV